MTFQQHIATAANPTASGESTGFTAPLIRASAHIIFALEALAAEREITDDEMVGELEAAYRHIHESEFNSNGAEILTTRIRERIQAFEAAVLTASTEYREWEPANRKSNLLALANAACAVGADLDTELTGFEANPGNNL